MKDKLQQEQFELLRTPSGYWYAYRGRTIKSLCFRHWPFHTTKMDRAEFLARMGFIDNDGGFPYMRSKEEALFLLILAITEYNETVTKSV